MKIMFHALYLFTATIAASLVNDNKSAPTKPGVFCASSSYEKFDTKFKLLHNTLSIFSLAFKSGIPMQTSRSNLPALRRAGSKESGLFVAPITRTKSPFGLSFNSKSRRSDYKKIILVSQTQFEERFN